MTFRISTLVAALGVLGLAEQNPVSAQPLVPNRPPANAFGNLFLPGSSAVPNGGAPYNSLNRFANGGFGQNTAGTLGLGNQNGYGLFAPYVLSMQPVVFNNRGHWYSTFYGHWYPNGLTNGTGVLSNGGSASGVRLGGGPLVGASTFGLGGAFAPSGSGGMPAGLGMPAAGANPGINR
jgi:hypothetical protein